MSSVEAPAKEPVTQANTPVESPSESPKAEGESTTKALTRIFKLLDAQAKKHEEETKQLREQIQALQNTVSDLRKGKSPEGEGETLPPIRTHVERAASGVDNVFVGAAASAPLGGFSHPPRGSESFAPGAGPSRFGGVSAPLFAAPYGSGPRLVDIKMKDLPALGREKEQLPYPKWKVDALAIMEAAQVDFVLENPFSHHGTEEEQAWYAMCNRVVYVALLQAVRSIPVLSDAVRRLRGDESSAYESWQSIKSHFVRVSDSNHPWLLEKVQKLKPNDGESMESFINRCSNLKGEFETYGLELEDKLLITQVFSKLSVQWRKACGITDFEGVSWEYVASLLQLEDNTRRQSNTQADDALLPLGWTKGGPGRGMGHRASSPPKERGSSRPTSPSKGPRSGPPSGERHGAYAVAPGKSWGAGPRADGPIVCWFCKISGHGLNRCNKKPAGWVASDADKKKADEVKAKLAAELQHKRKAQSEKDKAHAALFKQWLHAQQSKGSPLGPSQGVAGVV